jgi:tetratricopeptide (TPR) repeat protein
MRDGEAALSSAREALARAEALAPSVAEPEVLAFGETSRGLLFWKSAEWEKARDAFQRGADLLRFHGHGDTFERILNETFIAASDGNLGRLADQEAMLAALATRAQRRHDRFTLALVSAPLAEGRIMLGDLPGAAKALSLCRDWPKDPPTFLLLLSGCASARLAIAEGRLVHAISQLEDIENARNRNGLRFASGKRAEVALLRATAELGLAARGDSPTARRSLALRNVELPLALPPKTFHANGLRLRALARPEGARADLDRAVEILESCRSPVELAAALLQRGAWRRLHRHPGADDDITRGETLQRETGAADPTTRDGGAWTWRSREC